MADRTSTRTGSRRNTPQTVAEPPRVTRATRSQSHDVSDNDGARYSDRVQRKPKKAASKIKQRRGGQTATKGRRRDAPEQSDLSTVNETPSVVIGAEEGGEQPGDAGPEQLTTGDTKSSGRVSGISGTTARTSNSAQELADLAADDLNVLDVLPDLSESSQKFLSGLVPAEISSSDITRVRSGLRDKRSAINRSRNKFKVDLESCGPDRLSTTFLDIPRALPILYSTDGSATLRHNPGPVFHAANLAILASNILLYPKHEDESFLENLDSYFPQAFTNDGTGALQLAIDTRTQYAITQLSEYVGQPNFDHDLVLQQVLYNEDGKTPRGFNFTEPRSREAKALRKSMTERIRDIRHIWTEDSQASPIERLKDAYVWDDYVANMMAWVSAKTEETKAQLDTIELEGVIKGLKEELSDMRRGKQSPGGNGDDDIESGQVDLSGFEPALDLNAIGQQDERPAQLSTRVRELAESGHGQQGSPKLRHSKKVMDRITAKMKAAKAAQKSLAVGGGNQMSSTNGPSAQASTPERSTRPQQIPASAPAQIREDREPTVEEDGWRPQEDDEGDDDDDGEAFQTHEDADKVLQLRDKRDADSNKENQAESSQPLARRSLIDRQAGAERLVWRESQDLEVSQDEGFQQSHHRTDSGRQALQPINKRNAPETQAATDPSPAKRARFLEFSEDDEPQSSTAAPRSSQVYRQANTAAKAMTALRPKVPQSRTPWSIEETETLLDLINDFGTSWKLLKIEDTHRHSILEDRDQVALKDKARNMKFDYLKAGRRLPRNFDKIPLSKLLIDKLRGLGIVYDTVTGQREDAEE